MKKIILMLALSVSILFGMNLQTATKKELMTLKGIGPKKADKIIQYRKKNRIKSADDLKNIKGFGPKIIANIKAGKTVSKAKHNEKKKINRAENKKDKRIEKINKNKNLSKEEKKAKKQKVRSNTKKKKEKIRDNAKKKKQNKNKNKTK